MWKLRPNVPFPREASGCSPKMGAMPRQRRKTSFCCGTACHQIWGRRWAALKGGWINSCRGGHLVGDQRQELQFMLVFLSRAHVLKVAKVEKHFSVLSVILRDSRTFFSLSKWIFLHLSQIPFPSKQGFEIQSPPPRDIEPLPSSSPLNKPPHFCAPAPQDGRDICLSSGTLTKLAA